MLAFTSVNFMMLNVVYISPANERNITLHRNINTVVVKLWFTKTGLKNINAYFSSFPSHIRTNIQIGLSKSTHKNM